MNKINVTWGFAITLIVLAITTRFLSFYNAQFNFSAVGAMGLFGGVYFSQKRWAYAIPFAALLLSDVILNYGIYQCGFGWYSVGSYLSFALIFLAGKRIITQLTASNVLLASLSASLIFFFVSNAFSWQYDPIYSKDMAGLMQSYVAGIPFFWNTLKSDVLFSALMFGSFAWFTKQNVVISY